MIRILPRGGGNNSAASAQFSKVFSARDRPAKADISSASGEQLEATCEGEAHLRARRRALRLNSGPNRRLRPRPGDLTGNPPLVGVELVVKRLQRDPEFRSRLGFVAVVLVQNLVDDIHFDLAESQRLIGQQD